MTVHIQAAAGGPIFPAPDPTRTTAVTFHTVDSPAAFTKVRNGDTWRQRIPASTAPVPPPAVGGYGTAPYGSSPYGV